MRPNLLAPASAASGGAPVQWSDVARDLEIDTLVTAMAGDDAYIRGVAARILAAAAGTGDASVVVHRQAALRDCLDHPEHVHVLYEIVVLAIDSRKQHWFGLDMLGRYAAGTTLRAAIEMVQTLTVHLRRLRDAAARVEGDFASTAFLELFAQLRTELTDDWLAQAKGQLSALRFPDGMLFGASLGPGNQLGGQVLYAGGGERAGWWARLTRQAAPEFSFRLHPRDESGARALADLGDRAVNDVANAVAQSAEHVFAFLEALRAELAFYLGSLRLHEHLTELGVATCMPTFRVESQLRAAGLRDPCLALTLRRAPGANDLDAEARCLLVVTGANQGGKSTFLRSLGLAQLMLQAGMFVAATSYAGTLCKGLFTHSKREEDATLQGGKLDEELVRMSAIVERIGPGCIWLSNESFASTNEREGSQLLLDVVESLRARGISVWMVTHLLDAAGRLAAAHGGDALFLRAPRAEEATRTYRLEVGEPLRTSFAIDVYAEVFGNADTINQ